MRKENMKIDNNPKFLWNSRTRSNREIWIGKQDFTQHNSMAVNYSDIDKI